MVFQSLFFFACHWCVHEVDWLFLDGGRFRLLLVLRLVAELLDLLLEIFDQLLLFHRLTLCLVSF